MTTVSRYILEEGIEALVTVSLDKDSNSLVIQTAVTNHDGILYEELYAQEVYSIEDLLDFSRNEVDTEYDDKLSTKLLSPYDEDDDIQPYVQPIRKPRVQKED